MSTPVYTIYEMTHALEQAARDFPYDSAYARMVSFPCASYLLLSSKRGQLLLLSNELLQFRCFYERSLVSTVFTSIADKLLTPFILFRSLNVREHTILSPNVPT